MIEQMKDKTNKKARQFSIKWKMMIATGLLVFTAGLTAGALAVREGRLAVTRQVEIQLKNKAEDTAKIVNSRLNIFYTLLENVSKSEVFNDKTMSYMKIFEYIDEYILADKNVLNFGLVDTSGRGYLRQGIKVNFSSDNWFKIAIKGVRGFQAPFISDVTGKLIMTLSVPVFVDNKIIGVLFVDYDGNWLSNQIEDIIVGKTGGCYILDNLGTNIASHFQELVINKFNAQEAMKTDTSLKSVAEYQKKVLSLSESYIGSYEFNEKLQIAAASKMRGTNWVVIIEAPREEFMQGINSMRLRSIGFGLVIFFISLIVTFFIVRSTLIPIENTVNTLQDIAEGEGDLTVRLPVRGNDENTRLAQYFNQTIEKIGNTIKMVKENAIDLNNMGQALSTNMTETATSVNQISANIDGVKGQVLSQASGVTETSATMEQIMRSVQNLNISIERQATNVAESSSSIEEMIANVSSIATMLKETDAVIQQLHTQTLKGKAGAMQANSDVNKISEQSGALLEASSVIQNIASQTNLLAMNAAIEAAHAGDTGKGFAVVADEIRKLAEESNQQGKQIAETIKTSTQIIDSLTESGAGAEAMLGQVVELTKNVLSRIASVVSAMQEQERGSKEVLSAISDINTITNEVKDGSAEMLRGGEQVTKEMRKLDDLTRVITDSMNEMASGAVQINNAVQEVNQMSAKNKESIEGLTQEVNKFKV